MSTPLRRVKLNYQPHAPRVCFALHKARFPFSQEATELLTNYDGRHRHAIPTVAASGPRCPAKNGRGRGARTPDLRFWRPPLYQLSYTPTCLPYPKRNARHRQGMASLRRGDGLGKGEKCIFYNNSAVAWGERPTPVGACPSSGLPAPFCPQAGRRRHAVRPPGSLTPREARPLASPAGSWLA